MSSIVLLLLLLLGLVMLLFAGGLFYVAHRYPRLATPLTVASSGTAVLVAMVAVITSR